MKKESKSQNEKTEGQVVKRRPPPPPAPKGNQYAKGCTTSGRPTDYRPEYCDDIIEFFSRPLTKVHVKTITTPKGATIEEETEVPNELPTYAEYAARLGVTRKTLRDWCQKWPEFLTAYTRAGELGEDFMVKNAISGRFNSKSFVFIAQNYTGMREKIQMAGPDDKPLIPDVSEEERALLAEVKGRLRSEWAKKAIER